MGANEQQGLSQQGFVTTSVDKLVNWTRPLPSSTASAANTPDRKATILFFPPTDPSASHRVKFLRTFTFP